MIFTDLSVANRLARCGSDNRMSSLTQVGWYWNRLRCMSVAEIVERAGSSASRAVVRRRPAKAATVPAARLDKVGAVWLPKLEPAFHGLALKRADEVLSGQWRVFSRLLGLGFPPDFPTWGRLLFDAVDQMQQYPWRVILPGAFISLTVLSVNYIGDGLRDAMDPRIRGR